MDDLPQIPDGHLEDDFDFLRTLTIICSVALFGALGFYTWMIYISSAKHIIYNVLNIIDT